METKEKISKYRKILEKSKKNREFSLTQTTLEKLIELEPNNKEIKFELCHYLFVNSNIIKSKKLLEDLLKVDPNNIEYLKFYATQNEILKNPKKAVEIYKKIISLSPEDIFSYINIAKMYNFLGDYKKIIHYSEQGLKIDDKNIIIYNNLIAGLMYQEKFLEAFEYVKKIEILDNMNHSAISLGSYLIEQLGINHKFKFINSPMNYIREFKINNKDNDNFFKDIVKYIGKISNKVWEPRNKSTRKGFQTKDNLFSNNKNDYEIKNIAEIIKSSVKSYLTIFNKSDDYFIKKFPDSVTLKGWSVTLKNSGYQSSHNHPAGWISGVMYIQVPKDLKNDEGKIEFSTHGYDMPIIKSNISTKLFTPEEGKLLLFPSSIYHRTIPFKSNDDRISIAFDIIPKIN